MIKWEYETVTISHRNEGVGWSLPETVTQMLNNKGEEGWELITLLEGSSGTYFFKRPKQ